MAAILTREFVTKKNNNMIRYDLSSIMRRAWAIRKTAAAEIGCKVSEVIFGECLKIAWAEAEGEHAAENAAAVLRGWGDMSAADQVTMMKKCIHKAAKNEIRYSTEDHYLQFSEVPAFGLYGQHDLDEYVSETWLRVASSIDIDKLTVKNERRAGHGKRPISLVSFVYNAARASIAAIYNQDIKHERARCVTVVDENGEEYSYFDTLSTPDNTERSAVIRVEMERYIASRDEVDQKIMELLPEGYTERQIGKVVGMSGVAVHKRIAKMRRDLEYLRMA